MNPPVYEHCLGCGQDVAPCKVPDRCKLLGWRHVSTGFHGCDNGGSFASTGHEEPGWSRDPDTHQWVHDGSAS